jgi:O-antigen/teichoic acid export membrane protein
MTPEESSTTRERLSSGRLLARNTGFSLAGQAATLVVAFFAVPLLVQGLGTERFGVLALAWVVIGYAQVFDLGIGRALTRFTAERIGAGREDEVPRLFWTAFAGMLALGLVAGGVVALLSPWLVASVLDVPADLQRETLQAFWVLSAGLPLAIAGAALRAYLEAWQRFDLVNAVVIPAAVLTYFGPVLMLQFVDSLVAVVAAVVFSRLLSFTVNLLMVLRVTPALRTGFAVHRSLLGGLLGFGGWVTVWNVVNAFLIAADRFLVGALVSLTAVAYFATPYEVMTKLLVVSIALAGVFFPAFSLTLAGGSPRAAPIFSGGVRFGFIALFPFALATVAFAYEGLDLWLGPEFAENSEAVLQWLGVGVLIASLNQISLGLVQSGRPDLPAKLALCELPLYLGLFLVLLGAYGIEGAAAAWAVRAAAEGLVLLLMVRRLAPAAVVDLGRLGVAGAGAAVALAAAALLDGTAARLALVAGVLVVFLPLAWYQILGPGERDRVVTRLRAARGTA